MAVSRVQLSSIKQGFPKSRSFLDGNAAYDPAATFLIQRISGSGVSSVTFSSIPQTYSSLQIRYTGRITFNGGGSVYNGNITFNSDTGANYTWHALRGTGSSALAYGGVSKSNIEIDSVMPDAGILSNTFGTAITDIHDYTSTTRNKTVRTFNGYDANGSGEVWLQSGLWLNTNAITSITITNNGGYTFNSSATFALYGMK